MKILDINVGHLKKINFQGKEVPTYIFKFPINGCVNVTYQGLEGDTQADRINHGGADKAVYAYGKNHYAYWQDIIGQPIESGALGENMSLSQLNEKRICIGDKYACNDVVLTATQFRQPCFKLGVKFNRPSLPKQFIDYGFSGVYFKVEQQGKIQAGDELVCIEKHHAEVSVYDLFNACFKKAESSQEIFKKAVLLDDLPEEWRTKIERRLLKLS